MCTRRLTQNSGKPHALARANLRGSGPCRIGLLLGRISASCYTPPGQPGVLRGCAQAGPCARSCMMAAMWAGRWDPKGGELCAIAAEAICGSTAAHHPVRAHPASSAHGQGSCHDFVRSIPEADSVPGCDSCESRTKASSRPQHSSDGRIGFDQLAHFHLTSSRSKQPHSL